MTTAAPTPEASITQLPHWQADDCDRMTDAAWPEGAGAPGVPVWRMMVGNRLMVSLYPFITTARDGLRLPLGSVWWLSIFSREGARILDAHDYSWDCVEFAALDDAKDFFRRLWLDAARSDAANRTYLDGVNLADFDALEIEPVASFRDADGNEHCERCSAALANFFSVYARKHCDRALCIGDFGTAAAARAFAELVSRTHGLPIEHDAAG